MGRLVVVVPTDFSNGAKRALKRVAMLPVGVSSTVHLLHVSDEPDRIKTGEIEARLERAREQLLAQARAHGRALRLVTTHVRRGEPWVEIIRAARALDATVVVLGRRGAGVGIRRALGRTAANVALRSAVPSLVVARPPQESYRQPLVALQMDHGLVGQLNLLRGLLDRKSQRIAAVHAYHVPFEGLIGFSTAESRTSHATQVLQEVRRQLRHFLDSLPERDRKLRVQLVQDMPVPAVFRCAREIGADLICTGTHGRRGLARAWLGSVAEAIVANAACDVLIARSVQETFENR